ncbi:Peptidase S16 [Candidatus Hydrogenisulfobacillus filiaventi]|uniref:Peptidase S16 n=1 Tax=Candidatus Hydrogenisulfobacillus filiaventi TaxID=2707344 RepID=A0A6F8ZG19_9FIRM|nr:LON peptidase substrate-binding domain-containing protein [Bacillota bacterium]CAB1128884.1 Peptidase S16 [Candidatus Hydrogenisulfobacillus filiaventi]
MPVGRDTVTLPIFPLNAVLFPGMRLPLHVFEDRYRRLVRESLDRDTAFGVTYIRQGQDGDGPVEPYTIGTTARIIQSVPLPDGRYNITVVGVGRFHLLSYKHNGTYLVGQARFLPDLAEEIPWRLIDEARALGSEYWSHARLRADTAYPVMPQDAEALSYWIAQYLPIPLAEQQELLEIRTTLARLSKEVAILRTVLDTLRTERSG